MLDNQDVNDYLYHYTKFSTLKKIFIESSVNDNIEIHLNDECKNLKMIKLQFSDFHFLNDPEDCCYFQKILINHTDFIARSLSKKEEQDYCKELINLFTVISNEHTLFMGQFKKIYIFSLSQLKDSMLFWRQDYANDAGIALRFNKKIFKKIQENNVYVPEPEKIKYPYKENFIELLHDFLKQVVEEAPYANEIFREGFANATDQLKKIKYWKIKNPVWEVEQEWRMVIEDSSNLSNCEYFTDDEKGIPRCLITMPNPFDEIILGPTFSPFYIDPLHKWLEERGFGDIKITNSQGQLRSKF